LTSDINVYDIYRPCYSNKPFPGFLKDEPTHGQVEINGETKTYRRQYTNRDYTPWFYEKQSAKIQKYLGDLPPCSYVLPIIDWINRKDVRDALHVPDLVQAWEMCAGNDTVPYYSQEKASEWIYPLLKNKYRILFYSGDTDGAVPTRGSRQWITNMGWKINKQWAPYSMGDNQVTGYIEERDGLTFATVHGVGHMAPQWKKAETYHLIFNWLKGRPIWGRDWDLSSNLYQSLIYYLNLIIAKEAININLLKIYHSIIFLCSEGSQTSDIQYRKCKGAQVSKVIAPIFVKNTWSM